jgi:hypothetical protein
VAVELVHLDDAGDASGRNRELFSGAVADVGDVVWVAGPEVLSVLEAAQKKAVKDFGEREGVAIAGLIEGHGFFLMVVDGEQRRERYN